MSIKIFRKNNFVVIDAADLPVKYLASSKADFDHVQDGEFVVWNVDNVSEDYTFASADLQDEDGVAVGTTEQCLEYLTTNINFKVGNVSSESITSADIDTLSHFIYNPVTDKLEADRAIETTLNSLFLGEQHKMSSGAENIFFTNLGNNTNFYPMWGGLKDQSLVVNQGSSGFIPPSGRVYSDMFSLPLGGDVTLNTIGYSGGNYFGVNIAGLGITTTAGESVPSNQSLVYILSVNGRKVYKQILPQNQVRAEGTIFSGDLIEWFFDHPVEIHAGTTIFAEIRKIDRNTDEDFGVFQVREGDELQSDGSYRYQAVVHNRLFEDKDLELISPYLKYKAMDFGLDATGSTILLRDLSLGSDNVLVPHAVNTLEAVANGADIQIKIKDGAKILIESLPVSGVSVDGSFVNSVLNQAVVQLNAMFTNTSGFISPDTFVNSFTLRGNDLTLGLNDGVSYTVDVTSLGVDENNFVASGSLSGSDLVLTMDDATTVTIDASSLAVDENTTITFGTLANNLLTLNASDSSTVTIDVSDLAVDENLFVESGVLNGNDLELTMSDETVITVGVGSLAIDNNTTISSGVVNGTDIVLSLSDASIITIDASTLGGTGSSNEVVSGSVVGNNLVLVMSDATEITIDASNMINGSTGLASGGANWFVSYGTDANTAVNHPQTNLASGVAGNAPFYFGTALTRGSEMKWNHTLVNKQSAFGIWAGTEAPAGTYNSRVHSYNWSTAFRWFGTGFGDFNANMDLITNNINASAYAPIQGSEMILRFGTDGHLSLINVVAGAEVLVMKTTIALSVTEFNLQMGSDQNQNFPTAQVVDIESLWEVVHDYNNVEGGITNGILDHTVIKSGISIVKGEKIMFMLDYAGNGDNFGTGYTNASTGVVTAEDQLINHFKYQTNEALVFTEGGANDWVMSTGASGYFFAANLDQYRNGGGSGTIQGMFSLRFNNDGKLTIYDEDAGHKVATAKVDPQVGDSVHLYMGARGARVYTKIPVISKQLLSQSEQPDANYKPIVANQTATVEEGEVLNFQVVSSDNIVNQFVEVDAPSWLTMNQNSGILSGTAPAFLGTAADTIVVTCKAGNAIGGSVDFTVTVSVTEDASYTNSKSLQFNGTSSYLQGNATVMNSMDRATNGDGNSWSVSMWVKPNNNTAAQTLFVYGSGSAATEGAIVIKKVNANNITVTYGTYSSANIGVFGNAFTSNTWSHVMVTFDGGTTGDAGTNLSDYYSRFNVYVNGVTVSTIGLNANNGYTGSISGGDTSDNIFRFGRNNNVHNEYFDGYINQIAIWNSDQSANTSTIYNSGVTQDLSLLSSAPQHYYEVESSVTTVSDVEGSSNLTGYNFVASDLVTDTP